MGLRILLLDAQPVYRWGLKAHLYRLDDCEVVRGASLVSEALTLAAALQPDVAVIEASVPSLVDVIIRLQQASPSTKVLALASAATPGFVVQTLQAGATSLMLKTDPPDDLLEAIRETAAGRSRLSKALVPSVVEGIHQLNRSPFARLSPREQEVLGLLLEGQNNEQIAGSLVISKRTVETHLQHIYRKLDVRDRTAAILLAAREGWIGDPSVPSPTVQL